MPLVNGTETVLSPPDGYVVDFDNPQRRAVPQCYYVAAFLTVISTLCFVQRIYVKFFLVGGLGVDDAFIVVSYLTGLTTIALCLHMYGSGAGGVHAWEISVDKFNTYMLDVYLAAFIYVVCQSAAKIALLIFYLRLSPQRWFKMATWTTIALITGYTIGIFFPLLFACRPISSNWDVSVTGKCLNQPSLYIATAAANIASDLILFALPIPMVVRLKISQRQKTGLLLIFGIGSVTVVTSIVRVSLLPSLLNSDDPTWAVSYPSLWIIVEANLVIICASMPTMKKFMKTVAPRLLGSSYGSKSGRTGSHSKGPSRTYGKSSTNNHSRPDRINYSQFDTEFGGASDAIAMGPVMGRNDLKIMGGGHGDDSVGWGDSDSEKGIVQGQKSILQTTTVTVERS